MDEVRDSSPSVRFVPGTAVALVGVNVSGLIVDDPRSDLVRELWAAVRGGSGLDEVLGLLAAAGLRSLPSMGLIELDGDDVRVVVRGDIAALFEPLHTGRVIEVRGDRVRSWVEHVETSVGGVHLHVADDLSDLGAFETTGGLFPASRLALLFHDAPVAMRDHDAARRWMPPSDPVEPDTVGLVVDVPDSDVPAAEVLDAPADPAAPGEDADDFAASAVELDPSVDPIESVPGGVPLPAPAFEPSRIAAQHELVGLEGPSGGNEPAPEAAQLEVAAELQAVTGNETLAGPIDELVALEEDLEGFESDGLGTAGAAGAADDPIDADLVAADEDEPDLPPPPLFQGSLATDDLLADADADADADAEAAGPAEAASDEYDRLFGATQFRTVEDAAVREADNGDGEPTGGPALIDRAPQAAGADGLSDGDHDGMTITLAELRAMSAGAGAATLTPPPAVPPGTPVVQAVRCDAGHLNPPHASVCRICRGHVAEQAQVTVPRPLLAVLRFSDGTAMDLSRPLILGRAPKADGAVGDELPELLALPSPNKELSGTHLELRIDGWSILAVDRQSTNGTVITLPGRDPQRLHPGEPFPITIGTSVNLADESVFVLEAAP
jgi:hypothetical protein